MRALRSIVRLIAASAALTAGVLLLPASGAAADALDEVTTRFEQRQRESDASLEHVRAAFAAKRAAMEALWRKREEEIAEKWRRIERAVEQKWDRAARSTDREWVDYSSSYETRSVVNFEDGAVEITTLVPATEAGVWLDRAPAARAWKAVDASGPSSRLRIGWVPIAESLIAALPAGWNNIVKHLQAVLAEEARPGTPILAEQIRTRTGALVSAETAQSFLQDDVLPSVTMDPTPLVSRDGMTRVKVTARVPLAPDHVRRRAEHYADLVPAYAKRHGLDPRLVYAIIHTESYFNPRAQTPPPAYGLMQLVPRSGARAAYNFLFKDDQILDDDYLLDPTRNVELGAAYLHLLRKDLIPHLPAGSKANDMLICAYHWGPGNLKSQVLRQVRVQDLTDAQVTALLGQRTPEGVRMYFRRVRDRMSLYDDLASR